MSIREIREKMFKQEDEITTHDAILMMLSAMKEVSDDAVYQYELIREGIMALNPPQNVIDTFIKDLDTTKSILEKMSILADSTAKEILK